MEDLSDESAESVDTVLEELNALNPQMAARLTQAIATERTGDSRLRLCWGKVAPENIFTQLTQNVLPTAHPVPELNIVKSEPQDSNHVILEGDNMAGLMLLLETHRDKVDVIYIDPPYNTGKEDFMYNDKFVEEEDPDRHSRWLQFMKTRLTLAYELLSNAGTIFVSIDDNEAARLKLLIDQTFGEKNFVGEMIRKTKTSTDDKATGFNLQHETLLVYAKNIKNVNLRGGEKDLENYKNPDNDPNGPWVSGDPTAASGTAERNYFAVKNPHTGREDFPPKGRFWFFSKNTLPNYINSGQIVFRKTHKDTERGFTYKRYRDKLKSSQKPLKSLEYVDNAYMNDKGTKDLNNLLADSSFSYPKPATFIKDILVHATNNKKDAIVLDFFAGSGTTGQAVAELNAEDGGTRRCVLITNNENDIARSVTRKRMEAVLTGKWADGKTRPAIDGNLYYYTLSTYLEAEPDYTTDFQIRYQLADAAGPLVQMIHNAYTPTQNHDSWVTVDGEVLIYVPNVNSYADDPETHLPALLNNLANNPAGERHVYLYSNVTVENTAWLPALEARFPNWTIHVTLGHCQHVEHQKTRWQLNSRS